MLGQKASRLFYQVARGIKVTWKECVSVCRLCCLVSRGVLCLQIPESGFSQEVVDGEHF